MFEPGKVYRRRDLHDEYGGQRQGGIVTPADQPFIMLITGEGGEVFGYADELLEDGTFRYFGEGQVGDMQFVRGNRAIRDHASDGRDIHLFQKQPPAHLRYLGQFVCAGFEYIDGVLDTEHHPRRAIAFTLAPVDADAADTDAATDDLDGMTLDDLRKLALEEPNTEHDSTEAKRHVYRRSEAVKRYVKARANGTCEGCSQPAPFVTPKGEPYLEPHHTRRLSDGGPDDPRWVIGLCPTCHRRVHSGADGPAYNEDLILMLRMLEED